MYTYVNENNEFIRSDFIKTSAPFFKAFPEGKIYIMGQEVFDESILQGNSHGSGLSKKDFGTSAQFLFDAGTSGGNPLSLALTMNDLTKDNVSKKLGDNSGKSSLLSYTFNMSHGLKGDDVLGKDVISGLALMNAGKSMRETAKTMKKEGRQFGQNAQEFVQTIWDGVGTGKSIFEILSKNYQDKPKESDNK